MVKKDNKPQTTQKAKEAKVENKPIRNKKGNINLITLNKIKSFTLKNIYLILQILTK